MHAELYNKMHKTEDYRNHNQGIDLLNLWYRRLPIATCGQSIIEIGCGNGLLCKKLSNDGWKVTGVDIVAGDYDRNGYDFKEIDIRRAISYEEHDYAISFDVLEHLEEVDVFSVIRAIGSSAKKTIIFSIACYGGPPLHLTVKTPGWWLDICFELCPEFEWEVLSVKKRYEFKSPIILLLGEKKNGETE